ncbi:MAG: apolipoprotein N-acyltransferase [Ruminococcaceae bacterium]|nr:apolipoprotein N-acyltransferase [Oscillospiraceae bacterium]
MNRIQDFLFQRMLWRRIFLYGGAMLTALTLVIPQIGLLEWFSMIPLFCAVFFNGDNHEKSPFRAYGYGFLTIFLYYFVIYHWFVALYPLEFAGLEPAAAIAVILAGWLGLSLLQALPGGLIFVAYAAWNRTQTVSKHPILKPLLFSALWIVFEWSSTLGWTGVPWGRLCLGQAELLPMLQSASLFGSYGVSLLILLVNGLLAYALFYRLKETLCCALAAGLFLGNLLFGVIRVNTDFSDGIGVKAAVIQGNINSHEKWTANSDDRMMQIYGDLTREAAEQGARLIVWPETTITRSLNRSQSMRQFVSELARETNVTLLVGALYYDDTSETEYNSLYLVTSNGEISEQRYDKRHLVPFGEYVPMRSLFTLLIPPLAELSILGEDLSAGKDPALLTTEWGEIGSLICFDSIYETLTLDSLRQGANLLVISSNDSWFFDSAAVYQHQSHARLRAVESGKYLVRSANTGISTVMTPSGELLAWIPPLEEGYAVCDVYFTDRATLYSVIHNLLVWLCIAFVAGIPALETALRFLRRRRL